MGETKIDIRYEDLLNLTTTFNTNLSGLFEDLDNMTNKTNTLINDANFKGQGAEAIKAYFKERHVSMIAAIRATAQTLLDTAAIYKDMYAQLEPTTNFRIPQEVLEEYITTLNTKLDEEANDADGYFKQIEDAVKDAESVVSLEYWYPEQTEAQLISNHEAVAKDIQTYIDNAQFIEDEIVKKVGGDVQIALKVIVTTNSTIGTAWGITGYTPGTLDNTELFKLLNSNTEALDKNHNANAEYFSKVWEREAKLAELATQRQTEGVVKIAIGVGVCIVGVACIIVSCGSSTPVVVGAVGTVIGGLTAASSTLIVVEGISDINLASKGDLETRPVNPVKNVLYEATGSDDLYYIAETTLVCLAASYTLGIGVGSFGFSIPQLAGFTVSRGTMTAINIGIPTAVGTYVGVNTYKETGNGYYGVAAGGMTSYVTGVMLPAYEQGAVQSLGGIVYKYNYYDAYSRLAFQKEFEMRARTFAGLSADEAREAYNAFISGDYDKMASYLNLQTPKDGAVFWTGVSPAEAEEYAKSVNGKTLSMTQGGSMFNNWNGFNEMYPSSTWNSGLPNDQRPIWVSLSRRYAEGASGTVYHMVPSGVDINPNSIWATDEYAILSKMEKLGQVTILEVPH